MHVFIFLGPSSGPVVSTSNCNTWETLTATFPHRNESVWFAATHDGGFQRHGLLNLSSTVLYIVIRRWWAPSIILEFRLHLWVLKRRLPLIPCKHELRCSAAFGELF